MYLRQFDCKISLLPGQEQYINYDDDKEHLYIRNKTGNETIFQFIFKCGKKLNIFLNVLSDERRTMVKPF